MRWIFRALALILVIMAGGVKAQTYTYCVAQDWGASEIGNRYVTPISPLPDGDYSRGSVADRELTLRFHARVKTENPDFDIDPNTSYCFVGTEEFVTAGIKRVIPSGDFYEVYRSGYLQRYRLLNWGDAWAGGTRAPTIKRLTLHFQSPTVIGGEGYTAASIDVAYQFIQCAGEVQVAYSIDPKSLQARGPYHVRRKDGAIVTVEAQPPTTPAVVPLLADARAPGDVLVGQVDDKTASESLGMGCFDGQTQKIGTVATLVGAGATPDKVKRYLASLTLVRVSPLAVTLRTRHAEPLDAAAAARAKQDEAAAAEAKAVQDQIRAGIERDKQPLYPPELSAKVISEQKSAIAKREAERADYARRVQASEAAARKYQADMQAHAAAVQKAADERAAWEKRVAACTAGDRSQCQQ